MPADTAAVRALQSRQQQSVIEVCGRDVLQITAYYYEIGGASYVLETVQRSPYQATLDVNNGERIMRELSGYNTKLYRDALTSKRCYKEAYSHEKAMRMILGGECGAFNPLLLQCLQDIQLELRTELAL